MRPPPVDSSTGSRQFKVHGVATKFFGRRDALEVLYNAVRDAVNEGQLRVVTVHGDTGIGKTRLVHEFLDLVELEKRGIGLLLTDSVEDQSAHSLRIADQIIRQRFRLGSRASPEACRRQLRIGLGAIVDERHLATAADLLSLLIGVSTEPPAPGQSEKLLDRALQTLLNLLRFDASRRPLILVLDGFQHAGPREHAILRSILATLAATPTVVIVMGRGPVDPALLGGASVMDVALEPLPDSMVAAILRHLVGRLVDAPEGFEERMVQRARGIPAVVEDIVRLLFQQEVLVPRDGAWGVDRGRLAQASLPSTVPGVAEARVAGLGPRERAVLQMASVFGTTFWFRGVLAMMRLSRDREASEVNHWIRDDDEARLKATLLEAQGLDLVEYQEDSGVPGQMAFSFVRPAEQQEVYQGIVPEQRALLHRMAAQWLARVAPASDLAAQIVVGWHREAGGDPRGAAAQYVVAARLAAAASQHRRGAELYRRAVELWDETSAAERADAYGELSELLLALNDLGHAEVSARAMLFHSTLIDSKAHGGVAYLRLAEVASRQADVNGATETVGWARRLLSEADDPLGVAACDDALGQIHLNRGEFGALQEASQAFRKALEIRRRASDRRGVAETLGHLGRVHLRGGEVQMAAQAFAQRELEHARGVAAALVGIGEVHYESGRLEAAREFWAEGLAQAAAAGDREAQAILRCRLGEVLLAEGHLDEAEARLDEAWEAAAEMGDRRTMADVLRHRATAARQRRRWERAIQLADEAVNMAWSLRDRGLAGRALTSRGELYADVARLPPNMTGGIPEVTDPTRQAAESYQQAIAALEKAGDQPALARALRALAAACQAEGDHDKAVRLTQRAAQLVRLGGEPPDRRRPAIVRTRRSAPSDEKSAGPRGPG